MASSAFTVGQASLRPEARFGRYRLVRLMGVGHTAEVWQARDHYSGTTVALKVLRADWPSLDTGRLIFQIEREALGKVRHAGVPRLLHGGRYLGERPYLALEHLAGETLDVRLERGPLPTATIGFLAESLADTLHAVHRAGLLHLDLQPRNVMLLGEPGARPSAERPDPVIRLFDFGSASASRVDGRGRARAAFPSPGPRAPELDLGGRVDERTDLWGLGRVLLEAAGASLSRLTPVLRVLLPRLLADNPELRPHSAAMVADLLKISVGTWYRP